MKGRKFLDTNIFVYCFDGSAPAKRDIARALVSDSLQTHEGVISAQVVQEFLNVSGKKFARKMTEAESMEYLEVILWPLCLVIPNQELFRAALKIKVETGFTFYDSLIVAAALSADCKYLCTEDLQAGRKIQDLEIINPFAD